MCRHLAWLGPPRTLAELVVEPEFGLLRQSYAPRRQRHGAINADGFGAAWYVEGLAEPVRYRRAQPMWTDASFASLARTMASGCVLAAVRSASVGTAADETCAAPFTDGAFAFSHNGRIVDWVGARRAWATEFAEVPEAWCGVDSSVAFGLAAAAWRRRLDLVDGLREAVRRTLPFGNRLTFVATDGHRIAGSVVGEPMYVTRRGGGVIVASEPDGAAETGWELIPDTHLIEVARTDAGPHVRIMPLDAGAG